MKELGPDNAFWIDGEWLRIPGYSATYSDSIRPPIPGYPATFDALH